MTLKELREKSDSELRTLLLAQQEQLRALRFRVSLDEHKDVREIRETRKTVARILTLMHERTQHHEA